MRADFVAGCVAVAALASLPLAAADVEAEEARTGGKGRSHWHVGPFFEYRRADPGPATYWAVRPFYSQVRDPATRTVTRDVLWPFGAYHCHNDASWYRALIAYGDARDVDPSWSFNVFPLWFCGKDRTGEGYWGAFPLYGEHPHFLFMDDWQFVLWPIWQTYTVKDVRSHGVLWPIATWASYDEDRFNFFPFWTHETRFAQRRDGVREEVASHTRACGRSGAARRRRAAPATVCSNSSRSATWRALTATGRHSGRSGRAATVPTGVPVIRYSGISSPGIPVRGRRRTFPPKKGTANEQT